MARIIKFRAFLGNHYIVIARRPLWFFPLVNSLVRIDKVPRALHVLRWEFQVQTYNDDYLTLPGKWPLRASACIECHYHQFAPSKLNRNIFASHSPTCRTGQIQFHLSLPPTLSPQKLLSTAMFIILCNSTLYYFLDYMKYACIRLSSLYLLLVFIKALNVLKILRLDAVFDFLIPHRSILIHGLPYLK